jgi:hypothetical protein
VYVTAVKSRGCFQYVLTNQQVELLSKISFLERNNQKINTKKLHQCIPILTTLYRIIVRYQRKINRDFKPAEPKEATIHTGTINAKDYCPLKVVNGIKVVKIEDKYKFESFDYQKQKEIYELEKEISQEDTEYQSVYEKEVEEKLKKYDELVKRKEEKQRKQKEQVKQKLKKAKNLQERKKILKEYFKVAKNEVNQIKIEGFEYSIKTQYTKLGLAGYLSVITNDKYMKGQANLATKQIMRERMVEFESKLPDEEKILLQEFKNKEKKEEVIGLVQQILAIKEENEKALIESRRIIQEEKETKQYNKQRFYMLGDRPFAEIEFDILDEKAKQRLKPYLRLITERMAKHLINTKYEEEEAQAWANDKEMEEEFNARYS